MSNNVYYYPENVGLEVVGHLDEDGLDYEFHILGVWRTSNGSIVWAEDSGCSCPVPFEDYHYNGPEDHNLEADLNELLERVREFPCHEDDKTRLLGWMGLGF